MESNDLQTVFFVKSLHCGAQAVSAVIERYASVYANGALKDVLIVRVKDDGQIKHALNGSEGQDILFRTEDEANGAAAVFSGLLNVFHEIVGAFQLHAIIKDTRKLHSTLLMIVGIAAYVTIITGIVLLIANPVNDLWFYGGCLFCLLGAFALSAMMIRCYNLKASRPLPQYFRREGGLNDAQ